MIFSELNEARQTELMHKATYLQFEQGQENDLMKTKDLFTKEELKNKTGKRLKRSVEFLEIMNKLDNDQLAAMSMLINELSPGNFSNEEEIEIKINSRNLSIDEYINKYIPGADSEKAKAIKSQISKSIDSKLKSI